MCKYNSTSDSHETHDSPFKAEHNLADEQDWFRGSKKDDEEKAAHNTKRAEEHFSWAKGSDKPAIEDRSDDGSAACASPGQ